MTILELIGAAGLLLVVLFFAGAVATVFFEVAWAIALVSVAAIKAKWGG